MEQKFGFVALGVQQDGVYTYTVVFLSHTTQKCLLRAVNHVAAKLEGFARGSLALSESEWW